MEREGEEEKLRKRRRRRGGGRKRETRNGARIRIKGAKMGATVEGKKKMNTDEEIAT